MSWQGVALKYQLPTPHHTYQWLSSNHADDSQLVAFIRCPVVFPPIGQSTAASLSVIHLGFVFGYHQLLFVIISILKINVFNGSSWWGWDACAFFQGDVLHVKRIDFSASRWISGLKTTCGTSNKSWVGNDSRWMKTLRILTWTCGVFILDSAELLAQEHASRFGRDGPNLCLQRGDVPMLLYILSRLPLLYIYISLLWNKCFGIQPWKDIGYQIWQIWKGMRPEKKYIQIERSPQPPAGGQPRSHRLWSTCAAQPLRRGAGRLRCASRPSVAGEVATGGAGGTKMLGWPWNLGWLEWDLNFEYFWMGFNRI